MTFEQQQGSDPFAPLYSHQFMVLTTFRKSGVAVPTTVWFAHENGKLYVTTSTNAGKLKRIRNNGNVLLAPSDRVGNVLGDSIKGHAQEVSAQEHIHAQNVLRGKYGAQFDEIVNNPRVPMSARTYIEIQSA